MPEREEVKPYTAEEALGVAIGIREEGIVSDMWDEIAATLDVYADLLSEVAQLTKERDEARALTISALELHETMGESMDVMRTEYEARINGLVAEVARLREGLEEYGRHRWPSCAMWCGPYRVLDPKRKCTCGFADLIAKHPAIAREMGVSE